MIQIQSSKQFTKAAERLTRERMNVRRAEPHMWEVTNKSKGTSYNVRFTRQEGSLFALEVRCVVCHRMLHERGACPHRKEMRDRQAA